MERAEWLKQMRERTQTLYDRYSSLYWEKYGMWISETHVRYLLKFLRQMAPGSHLLSAGCGAGLYEGILLEAGHTVLGIDLSEGMLDRARERNPGIHYERKGVQEMDFHEEFDGAICMDALEHVFPEDWPRIVHGFHEALKPGGWLYFTLEVSATNYLEEKYESALLDEEYKKAKSNGLPAVYGELVADIDEAYERVMAMDPHVDPGELGDRAVYHYYPPLDQVRQWLAQEHFVIESEEMGIIWYRHFLVRKTGGN